MIQNSVADLLDYTKYHFTREEAMLEKARYPELPTHRAQHRVFVGKVEQFQREIKEGKTFQSVAVATFLRDWLISHIQQTDKRYSTHLNACGVS